MPKTDYSLAESWIVRQENGQKPVDVFHLVPTSWLGGSDGRLISSVSDEQYRAQAEFNFNLQASVYFGVCNLFAPHYRQLEPYYCVSLSPDERMERESREPLEDVYAALDYYFAHLNCGRPFILSGHSQGTILMIRVLADYMRRRPEEYSRMVAAYVPGYSITRDYLRENPHLRFAEGADDTGVIISYNTEAPTHEGINPVVLPGAVAINPVSWSRGYERAPKEQSRGSVIKGRFIPQYADAQIEEGTGRLVCTTAEPRRLHSNFFPDGIYHMHDFGLYFYDLRRNAETRIEKYLSERVKK